jgi:TetR/AcrR family fatty acid metabolism transcriptional regulator
MEQKSLEDPKSLEIMNSATKVFSKKGYRESTISEIAKGVGVSDSSLYSFFKSKEEMLFAIPEYHMNIFLTTLREHLGGIKGTENKIGKLIWYHCHFFTTHKDYTKVLIFECRSNPRFYTSTAYQLIRDHSKILIDLIEEGKREGEFCRLTSSRLLRDMLMGTIDHVSINWLMKNTPSPLEQADDIYELVIRAFKPETDRHIALDSKTKKRRQIINAATKVFCKKGYDESSISEIANEAGVADGTIYEYFDNKENLLINIPEDKLRDFLRGLGTPENRLKELIREYCRLFDDNRDYTSIIVLMLRPNRAFYNSASYKILDEISKKVKIINRSHNNSMDSL